MKTILIVFFFTLGVVALCFAGLGIKMVLKRNGEFKRHCSSIDPYTGKGGGCECAKRALCDNRKKHPYQPLEVNQELLKEMGKK